MESQVSERARISSLLSEINSCKAAGLSRSEVIEAADLMLRCEQLRDGDEIEETGPGFISMSPERIRRREIRKRLCLLKRKPR